ncbi:hypothetical protein OS493_005797 [Desmophyllum pertusum]|uniref:Uncharacterized protein n=1 Tax=Desmophyllum pertusum TaxID=174260 RepID=A0A9W9YFP6_9CNID|nr:hypothetical protein OS493_005797 [Desmophyllum pertusum]
MVVLQDALEFVGWELIGVVSQAIVDGVESDTFQECNKILYLIAENCSAKEVCIGALQQLDSAAYHFNKFVALLDQYISLKEKKSKFVGMVLPCVTRYIRGIQLSDEVVDQKESGSKCPAIQSVLKHVLDFLRPLVQEVSMLSSCSGMSSSSSYITSLQTEIIKCLIQLLDYPLVFIDLTKEPDEMIDSDDEDSESNSETKSSPVVLPYRQFAQEIMVCAIFRR